MTDTDHADRTDELGRRLGRDAATWEAEPSAEAVRRLERALAESPSPHRARAARLVIGSAALLVVVGVTWAWCGGLFAAPEKPGKDAETAVAMEPLRRELAALSSDASAFADAVWRGVPAPLRRLIHD